MVGVVLVAFLGGLGLMHAQGNRVRDELTTRMEAVRQRRADIYSATQREAHIVAYWEQVSGMSAPRERDVWEAPLSPRDRALERSRAERIRARDAEITGAENRVHIAIRRYDEAAANYNRYAELVDPSVSRGFPHHVPYSNEVSP